MAAKVVLALLSEHQEFQLFQAAAARRSAAEAGLTLDLVFAENNAVLQIHQLFKHIHAPEGERPAGIVVETVTGEGLERVARNAVKAGIGWVLLNRSGGYLESLRKERGDLPIASVSVDNDEVGAIEGRQLRALLPEGGRVLYLEGPQDTSTAQERLSGAQRILAGTSVELKVLSNDDWTEASGEKAVATWLRLKTSEGFQPVAVCGQNDALAVGARRALAEHRPEWRGLFFLGCDGLPEGGQRLVGTGELTATIVTPPPAGAAVELVARALAGQRAADLKLAPRSHPSAAELAARGRSAR